MNGPIYGVLGCLTLNSVVTAPGARFANVCGGNALYAAAGAAIWDQRVGIVTRAGADYPEDCFQAFQNAGLSLAVHRTHDQPGLHVAFAYRADGSRSRQVPSDVLARIPPDERPSFYDDTHVEERYLAFSPAVSDIPATWWDSLVAVHTPQLRKSSHLSLARTLRDTWPHLRITMDAWHAPDGLDPTDSGLLRRLDAFLPSEEDAQRLCPERSAAEAAGDLQRCGARHVVIKLGGAGCHVLSAAGDTWEVPAYPATVADLTGAGDAFCGGFMVGLHETGDPVAAAVFGTVSASFVVEHSTPDAALGVTREAAEERREAVAGRIRGGGTSIAGSGR